MGLQFNIAVVGCGVAGATAALMLARRGHRVTLFEQSERVGPAGAGILLQPSGQGVLRGIGLLDEVIASAEPIREIYATTHRGHELIRLRYADLSPKRSGYGLHRGDLFTVLHLAMLAAGVDLRLNQPVTSFAQNADHVWPIAADGVQSSRSSSGGSAPRDTHRAQPQHEIKKSLGEFDLLIAADGSRSRLRESSGIAHWTLPYAGGAAWVVGRNESIRGQLRQVTHGTRRLCGLLPMGGGRCSLFWGMHEREQAAVWAGEFSAWREDVVRLMPQASPMFDQLSDFAGVKFVRYQHVSMSRWHSGRAVFIGDAAHAMSPHLGQGVNLALVDARELCTAIDRQANVKQAVIDYERRRRRALATYAAVTFSVAPYFQSVVPLLGWGRDLALPWMPRFKPLRQLMLRTLCGGLGASRGSR